LSSVFCKIEVVFNFEGVDLDKTSLPIVKKKEKRLVLLLKAVLKLFRVGLVANSAQLQVKLPGWQKDKSAWTRVVRVPVNDKQL
jgi:hypothetical protein